MNIKECYELIGGDYDSIKLRLQSDERIRKYALMFLEDGSMQALCEAMGKNDLKGAFQAAHTLKGVCLTLSFDSLAMSTGTITEQLRSGAFEQAAAFLPSVEKKYKDVCEGLNKLKE